MPAGRTAHLLRVLRQQSIDAAAAAAAAATRGLGPGWEEASQVRCGCQASHAALVPHRCTLQCLTPAAELLTPAVKRMPGPHHRGLRCTRVPAAGCAPRHTYACLPHTRATITPFHGHPPSPSLCIYHTMSWAPTKSLPSLAVPRGGLFGTASHECVVPRPQPPACQPT